jgi:hypothetical protein
MTQTQTADNRDFSLSLTRQKDSKAVFICPACHARRYVGRAWVEFMETIKTVSESTVQAVAPRHKLCNAIMEMTIFPADIPEPLTVADLNRVFFRTQNSQGHWRIVDAKSATDEEFDAWARSRVEEITGEPAPWSETERAGFCDTLWQTGALHVLKKDVEHD